MKRKELEARISEMGIRPNTMSFYCNKENEECESFFGTCEISGERGMVVPCIVLDSENNVIEIECGEWLVHGHLGRMAGAF